MKKTTKLQELFHRGKPFVIAGGGCALHARIAEMAGYECAYMSGATTAAMILGLPDAGLITQYEMVQNGERMASSVNIPLICDSDQGFGTAINVRRTVQEFIAAGVSGIHIEDQPFPKRCGFVKGKEVISIEEAAGKYRAAVDAKNEIDPDFVIIARCDARGTANGSVEEVIKRAKAYKEAGVDVIYAEALTSLEEVKAVRAAIDGPIMGTLFFLKPQPTLEELQALGYSASFQPGLIAMPILQYTWNFGMDFQERGVQAQIDYQNETWKYPAPNIFEYVDFNDLADAEQKYLPEEWLKKYEGSIGAYDPRKGKTDEKMDNIMRKMM